MTPRIIEVSDGGLDYPRESLLPPEVCSGYPATLAIPYRPVVLESGGGLVLLDTGAGPLGPRTGQLPEALKAAGISPEQIGMVVLSHAHADHIGGLAEFPRARIVISRQEFDFWKNSGIRDRLGSGSVYRNAMIETVIRDWFERYLLPLESRLELVEFGTEVAPGMTILAAPGHTPGHAAILAQEGGEKVLFAADAFTLAEHIPQPEWTSSFDLDPELLFRTRRRLLDLAAAEECRVIHYHIGSVGRVVRRGSGYAWEAESAPVSVGATR
jgi:glyoxylase-like metal-dependent hydrolase (beta-lactamase superfamily II)